MPRRPKSPDDIARDKAMGRAIRELRKDRDLSQDDLAVRAELTQWSLSQIETGQCEPKWGTLRAVAAGLNIPLDLLCLKAEELISKTGPTAPATPPG